MKAVELFEAAKRFSPEDQARYITSRLAETLEGSPVSLWRVGDPIPSAGQRTLLGIAPYSLPDLQLLDALRETLERKPDRQGTVQIFDVLNCATMGDLDAYIPGIGRVYQTPVVGIWEKGVVVQKGCGAKARLFIVEKYQLSA